MTATKKPKLSWIAERIVTRYRELVKGGEQFLSRDLKDAMLAQALVYVLVVHSDSETAPHIKAYTAALAEASEHLWPEVTE